MPSSTNGRSKIDRSIYFTEKHLLNVEPELMVDLETDFPCREGHGLILSRTRLDLSEAPKGKKLEAVKQLMMRVHRAAVDILDFPSCKIYYEHEALLHGRWNWVEPWNALNAKKLQSLDLVPPASTGQRA